jgi:DNA polymerase II small subunit
MRDRMDEGSIVRKFLDADFHLTPDALEVLQRQADGDLVADRILLDLRRMDEKPIVVNAEIIEQILKKISIDKAGLSEEGIKAEIPPPAKTVPELTHLKFKPFAREVEARVEVLMDVTGHSYGEGEIEDFLELFKDRYERISKILRNRSDFRDVVQIRNLRRQESGDVVKVIGMVSDKRETSGGHLVMELEDLSGKASVWIFKKNKDMINKAAKVVLDEVIGVEIKILGGDRGPRLMVSDIFWPDLPSPREPARADEDVCAVLLSDLHVGSEMFLEDAFLKFLRWLKGEIGNSDQRDLAGRVKYLVMAGDLVDGVGIYPRQDEELLIQDIFKQYDVVAELLAEVPDYIKIIAAPGNHDAVRPSEPQPAIPRDVAPGLFDLGAVMVGNPVWVKLHGVKFLIYHGRSFDDLVSAIPGLGRDNSTPVMIHLLQKRHLAPIYGERVAIAPEERDYLIIDDVPDVFHCGHMHVYGCDKYRDVIVVNSGTFQEKTIYMKSMGVEPTPGIVPIVDLKANQARAVRFV